MDKEIKDFLLKMGVEKRSLKVHFTDDENVNRFINDIDHYPHAYVLGCFMNRQYQAEKAWQIPYEIGNELKDFSMASLVEVSRDEYIKIFKNKNLHRFNNKMANVFYSAVQRIHDVYNNDVSLIWRGNPGSAEVVNKFMEFEGVGIKIATMTANILVRHFGIDLSDYHFIDISPDMQVRKVLKRLGLIRQGASVDQIIGVAREINPNYPGIIDGLLWDVGRTYCSSDNHPNCEECYLSFYCDFYKNRLS